MTRQERRVRARCRREKEVARKKMILLFSVALCIVIGSIIGGSLFASAKGSSTDYDTRYKYYKSIVIEDGDSLWSIASEYYDMTKESKQDYIQELVSTNKLASDKIHTGQHLIVAYYDNQLK
ncbi:MAG: LysM peptidoglycan-binding domain-containing protein [Faecalimonas sp.]|nr:LysM peptidoglycan-binding domain-containing protein [Faecalimonas sp.]